jgi:NADH:ubiquinone oxidoreductase subunit K
MRFFLNTQSINRPIDSLLNFKSSLPFLPAEALSDLPWTQHLNLFYLLFLIGLTGLVFNYRNYLVTLFCIELMYLGITISFIIVSNVTLDFKGQIYAILLLILAAAESAIGLGVLIVLYRFGHSINFNSYQELKG